MTLIAQRADSHRRVEQKEEGVKQTATFLRFQYFAPLHRFQKLTSGTLDYK
jgi:hypothetical protein